MLKKFIAASTFMAVSQIAAAQTDSLKTKTDLQELVVKGIKANVNSPITQTTLDRKQIELKYYGADIPTLINSTPSINGYSDNGMGIGYSFFRLRGMDQTRVNTTVNGIPVNDPENMGVFFNNFADLASSAESIQIQRGVGSSTTGVASFGGSVNILTKNLAPKQSATVNLGIGSFGSSRVTLEYQSGLLKNKLALYGRISNLQTDGYRDNSGAKVTSYFFSAGYFWKKAVLKFNMFGGFTQNKLAYLGIDYNTLNTNRVFNPLVNGERDEFKQTFYQLHYSYQINSKSNITTSAYFVRGEAPKFQYYGVFANEYLNLPTIINGTDTQASNAAMTSYRLNQYFVGAFINYQYKFNKFDFTANMHANSFSSDHFLEVQSIDKFNPKFQAGQNAFFNTGYKNEISLNFKLNYSISNKLMAFGDIQFRNASFTYSPERKEYRTIYGLNNDNLIVENMNWAFINYRLGVKHQFNSNIQVYAMFGRSNREPARIDYFKDEHPYSEIKQSDIKHETVNDLELGFDLKFSKLTLNTNLFYMDFENQIAATGSLNAYGAPINTNVGASVRKGIEVEVIWKPNKMIWLTNSSSLSQNTIDNIDLHYFYLNQNTNAYTDTVISKKNATTALSPSIIINQGIKFIPTNWFFTEFNYRFVSMQYLDNSEDKNVSIPNFHLMDIKFGLNLKKWVKYGEPIISVQINNLANQLYTPSGSVMGYTNYLDDKGKSTSVPLFFPAATRNIFVGLTWKF